LIDTQGRITYSLPEKKGPSYPFLSLEFGEAVTAFVISKSHRQVAEGKIIAHCKKSMASYKAPKKIFFVTELPKSSAGKILRRTIRENY